MKEKWEYKNFEECLEPVFKNTKIQSTDYKQSGQFPIISQEESLISGYWDDFKDVLYLKHPVVIFGDHTRVLKYIDFDFVIGADGVKVLSPKDFLSSKFLFYYLKWENIPSLGYSRHYKLLKELKLPIPSLSEQERIVAELDLLSLIIEKQKQQLKELDTLAQSIFFSMFGDPILNDKNWEIKKLGEICKLSAGGDKPTDTTKEQSVKNSIPVYSNGIENEGLYGFTSTPKIVEPSLTISGRGTIGVPFIRKYPFVPIIRLIVATPFEKLNLLFLYYIIKLLKLNGNGGAIPQLTVPMIKDLKCIFPPISLQNQFAEKIERIEKQKETINKSIEETQKLFDYTMDKYFG